MDHVHVFDTERVTDYWWRNDIERMETTKAVRNPIRMIETKNGDTHYYMTGSTYSKWCMGRAYFIEGKLYYSDLLMGSEGK